MARARLLVVDDEPFFAQQITKLLGSGSTMIESSCSGEEAVQLAVRAGADGHPYDVILLDYFMPGRHGVEVFQELRQSGVEARIILMSGRQASEVAVDAMRLGAFDFIAKPFNRAELSARVER
ncbi:MAG: response regulator, partial [Myxococcota bacterium]